MRADASSTLVVVQDRRAASELEALVATLARNEHGRTVVVTTDPLLCMRLAQIGLTAHQTTDGLDRDRVLAEDTLALEGTRSAYGTDPTDWSVIGGVRYGPYLEYTLIPKFISVVRDLHGLNRVMARGSFTRMLAVGRGELVRAAILLARHRGLPVTRTHRGPWQSIAATAARIRAGAHVRWVNTSVRALILEPAVLLLLLLRGLLTPRPSPVTRSAATRTMLVTGDRFTRDIIEQLRDDGHEVVVAGATLPGRRLFHGVKSLIEIERFGRPRDVWTFARTRLASLGRVWGLLRDTRHHAAFSACGVPYWPLVRSVVALHLFAWPPLLKHLALLVDRACEGRVGARLFVAQDVTAYNRVLIDSAHAQGVSSVGVQHGILGEPNGHSIARVRTLATWGDYSERWYRDHGVQHAEFVITGNPKFDLLAGRLNQQRPRRRGAEEPFTVAVCTGFVSLYSVCASDYENLLMLQTVMDWSATQADVRIIHKLHPGEEPDYYRDVARALGWHQSAMTIVQHSPSLYDVLERADVMVSGYSTTVLESVALGTPAIVIDAIAGRRHIPLDASPDVTIAVSAADLWAALDRLRKETKSNKPVKKPTVRGVRLEPDWTNPHEGGHHASPPSLTADASATLSQTHQFLDDQLGPLDGLATARVCDLLRKPVARTSLSANRVP